MEQLYYDFGQDFENHVLSAVVLDSSFVSNFRSILNSDAFHSENNAYIVETVLSHYDKYDETPSIPVLLDLVYRGSYRDKGGVKECIETLSPITSTNYVRDQLVLWAKWSAIDDTVQTHSGSSPREFADRIDVASRIGDNLLLDHTKLDDDDESMDVKGIVIPTPWTWLNNELDGGPEIGDLAVILTVVGGGKTTALVNITRHALSLGKFVVYFTFEDGERKIKRRLLQSIANVTRQELIAGGSRINKTKNRFLVKYGGKCEIKDLPSRRCTVSDAAAIVRTIEENAERKVDVVVTDYADRFKPQNRYSEPRHNLREIFEDCKWLPRSLNVVHWTARQVNKSKVGKDIIGTDAAGESWGSMESPDLVIGLGQTMEDETMDRITMYTAKVRDENDHQVKAMVSDWERQRIYEACGGDKW